jgi:hypothetical protein
LHFPSQGTSHFFLSHFDSGGKTSARILIIRGRILVLLFGRDIGKVNSSLAKEKLNLISLLFVNTVSRSINRQGNDYSKSCRLLRL